MREFDPRVRLFWWFAVSMTAMFINNLAGTTVVLLLVGICWVMTGHWKQFIRFIIGMIPLLIMIGAISLYPTFDLARSVRMSFRYLVLLGATRLFLLTTDYGEMTKGIRNISHRFRQTLELSSFMLGYAMGSVPLGEEAWNSLKVRLRMRGVDIEEGNRIQRVRSGFRVLRPLILEIFERLRQQFEATLLYGYDPLKPRTLYAVLTMEKRDRIATAVIAVFSIAGVVAGIAIKG